MDTKVLSAHVAVHIMLLLTMVGTGSEMNGGAVITNHKTMMKVGHVFGEKNKADVDKYGKLALEKTITDAISVLNLKEDKE